MKRTRRYIVFLILVSAARPAMRASKGTVVIDAGHGGFDGGAVGKTTGVREDGLNLAVAKKLQELLEKNGYAVVMTRGDGEAVGDTKHEDMARRREIIEAANADIVVSVHMNKFPSASVSGPQVFFHKDSAEGEKLATLIQDALNAALEPPKPRVQHPETYYILKSGDCPAVIVECGFLSNAREEALLQDDGYQQKCAKAIYRGVDAYLSQHRNGDAPGNLHYPL